MAKCAVFPDSISSGSPVGKFVADLNALAGKYGVILDAGSSGTRLHIYSWRDSREARAAAKKGELGHLPKLLTQKKWTKKVKPGIATFAPAPQTVGPEHLQELFHHALEHIPKDEVENTPIFLLATAGMRLLEGFQRDALLAETCSYARKTTEFQLPECNLYIQVISGETEGLYGWVAANYLLGGFNYPDSHAHGKGHHTYGFLDLGGASAQIAFAPNATEAVKHANDLQLLRMRSLDGLPVEHRVFVKTWLGFGVNKARDSYVRNLVDSTRGPTSGDVPDPCLPNGLKARHEYGSSTPAHLIGTGKFKECLAATYPLLGEEQPCVDSPCLFHGDHTPGIDFDINHFVGVSEYWHTTHEMFEMGHTDKAYDFETYSKRVAQFCERDWATIEEELETHKYGEKEDRDRAANLCFKASWLINLLHEGFGIPHSSNNHNTTKAMLGKAKQEGYLDPFQAVNKIDNTEVSWTLGKMVLYAASQIPPADDNSLAVGFGSNEPGIPQDFQFAGANVNHPSDGNASPPALATSPGLPPPPDADTGPDTKGVSYISSWKPKNILTTSTFSLRRTPGMLLLLLTALIIVLILVGRDRRTRLFCRLFRSFPRRKRDACSPPIRRSAKRGASTILPFGLRNPSGGSGGKYERVLEEGDMHPGEFELGAIPSSSDEDLDSVRTSGSGTGNGRKRGATPRPRLNGIGSGYFAGVYDGYGSGQKGVGSIGLGLNVGSESKDRGVPGPEPAGAGTGHRSRNASPSGGSGRFRSPGIPTAGLKESID